MFLNQQVDAFTTVNVEHDEPQKTKTTSTHIHNHNTKMSEDHKKPIVIREETGFTLEGIYTRKPMVRLAVYTYRSFF